MDIPKGYQPAEFKYVSDQPYVRGQRLLVAMPFKPGVPATVIPVYDDVQTMGSYNHLNKQAGK